MTLNPPKGFDILFYCFSLLDIEYVIFDFCEYFYIVLWPS